MPAGARAAPGPGGAARRRAPRGVNVAVARMMELVNACRRAVDAGPGGADPAVREAAEVVAQLLSLVAPYTAEEMWELLGHEPTVATSAWPQVDERLLVEATVTCGGPGPGTGGA